MLSETLQLLLRRYALARPSYKRHLQIRCDITAVLVYAEELMWSVCESPEALVHNSSSTSMTNIKDDCSKCTNIIHNLCNQLLTVLVIVTAPLTTLYRTLINNPGCKSQPADSTVVRWLNGIDPDLFTEQVIHEGLKDQAASTCQLRLLTSDPGNDPRMLLRMLLYRDCHLPRILLQNSHFCQETDTETSPDNRTAGDNFMAALFNLFICLNDAPKALVQALQPYLERAHIWEHLYTLADMPRLAPAVVKCLRESVTKSIIGLLVHLVSMVLGWQATAHPKWDIPECLLAIVPKEWNYTAQEPKGIDKCLIDFIIQAMSLVFTNLPTVIEAVPLTIRLLFHEAEKHLSRPLCSAGLLIWALLGCLIQSLEDPQTLKQITGLALNHQAKECLALLAECLKAAIGIQHKSVPKPIVHIVLQTMEEKTPTWTSMQLQKAQKLYSESVFEQEKESSGVAAVEPTEQKISLMLLEVCHKAGGSHYLRQIYHIIQGNEELLMSKLCGRLDTTSTLVNFAFGQETLSDAPSFNPIYQFEHIGKKKLEQSAVVEWAWDWPRLLLPTVQGTSEVTFRTLLANRWEMREDADLEDDERAMVEELQKVYLVYSSGSGQQNPTETDEGLTEETQGETQLVDKSPAQ